MRKISDFTDADRWVVETALRERYGKPIPVEPADSEMVNGKIRRLKSLLSVTSVSLW